MTTLIRGGLIHDAVHRGAYIADILLAAKLPASAPI